MGAAEACGCASCSAFASARAELLEPALLALLERLGCDPRKEAELAIELAGPGPRRALAVGWRFYGRVLAAGDPPPRWRVRREERDPAGLLRIETEFELHIDGALTTER